MLYVDGDAAEYIWAGLTDEALGQDPPPGMPRPASWLPGHSLPRAQRPLATVRVIGDLERIGPPHRGPHAHQRRHLARHRHHQQPLPTRHRRQHPHLPRPPARQRPQHLGPGPSGRFGKDETRFESSSQNKNGYAHTATRFTVITQSPDADCDLIGAAAVLTNQGITSDVRQSTPTPLHLARRMDSTHPYYRRTAESTEDAPDATEDGTAQDETTSL